MKKSLIATALILSTSLIASSAFAADAGTLTREQVRASVLQARADGSLLPINDKAVIRAKAAPSSLTRAAVMAEYQASIPAGAHYVLNQPNDLPAVAAAVAPAPVFARSRVDVRAEAVVAARQHTQDFGG
jgi:hypothetical protein